LRLAELPQRPQRKSFGGDNGGDATMAIGRRKSDTLSKLAWDFEIGCMVLEDRVYTNGGWDTEQRNVENDKFRAVIDLPNIARGWIAYVKGEGLNAVLAPLGRDYGDRPSDKHNEGLRFLAKMDASLGGDVREFISTSAAIWNAVNKLHDEYLAGVKEHEGHLPAVDVIEVREEPIRNGSIRIPVFKISGWVPRPPELPAAGIPLVKRAKKANGNSADDTAGEDSGSRPKVEDALSDSIPF
jgi:hypothetical protein